MTSTVYTIWLREITRFRRDKLRFIGGITTPLLYLVLLGIGLQSSFQFPDNSNYLGFILPGVIGMSLLFTSIFSGISVIFERQFGFLKEMLVAPVPRSGIALGKIAGSSTIAMINSTILLGIGIIAGLIPWAGINLFSVLVSLLFMLLISTSFVSVGLALAAKMNSMEGFQFIMSFLVIPVFLLSGAFFPLESQPMWMKAAAMLDPLMYGVDGIRAALLGKSFLPIWADLLALLIFNAAIILVTIRLFKKM